MKRNLFVISIIMICFILVGCTNSNTDKPNEELLENVTMTIKDGTLTPTGATVIITDLSGDDNTYGEYFRIDKREHEKWVELENIVDGEYGFNAIGYQVNESNILEMDIDWEWLYGELTTGDYRLVKDAAVKENDTYIGNKYVYAEFTIE